MDAAHRVKPRNFLALLFLALLSLFGIGYILLNFPPGTTLTLGSVHISYVVIFFTLLFISLYGILAFLFKSTAQGFIIAGIIISFLLLRLFNITHPFFTILLLVFFASIEGILWKKK